MKVPLLDLTPQMKALETEIREAVHQVIDSGVYIGGPKVEELEKQIAAYCGAKHAIGASSGTDALLVALMALDIKAGDVVITTPYSFFASAGVIARLGATPHFVDIDRQSYNIDPQKLTDLLEKDSGLRQKVKAVMPVHLYGQCADMNSILAICNKYGIPVIEDAAQAIGATYPATGGDKKAGSMGAIGCFSFFPSKNLGGIGDGGMVVTNDDALADKLKKLRNHGASPKYYHKMIGGNFRLDPIQAAVLLVKLPHLETWHTKRRENAHYYDEIISHPRLTKPEAVYGRNHHIYNQYVLSIDDKRDELRKFLTENQIGNEVYYPVSFHEQECFQYLNIKLGSFPHSEHAARHTVAIPIYPDLTREMQNYVAEKLIAFCNS